MRTGSSLIGIMACRLCGARPLSEQMIMNDQLDTWRQSSWWGLNQTGKIFIHENAFENISCKMAAVLFLPQCFETQSILKIPHVPMLMRRLEIQNHVINTLRPRQNGRHFAAGSFKCILLNENVFFSPKFVPKVPINNILALVQIMAWRRHPASMI